ncbi:MAG: hypothetical protein J1F35_02125 [Erysipelotrichales bacterium]|nr:hypothetical protein [Erysipelotrichales bacterium]
MKKNVLKVMIIMLVFFSTSVKADSNYEVFYTNNNGLEFTEFQYSTLVDILDAEKVTNLTEEEYNYFEVENMIEGQYEYTTQEFYVHETPMTSGVMPLAYYETTSKRLTLSKTCSSSSYCTMSSTLTWKKTPAVTSYDVIGVRLVNTSFYDSTNDFLYSYGSTTTTNYTGTKRTSEGVGVVVKISSNINYVSHKCRVKPTSNGVVYASYQHAVKDITFAKAIDFTFSGTGYGSVFVWPSSYGTIYDKMGGASVNLA